MRAVISATRAVLLGAPLDTEDDERESRAEDGDWDVAVTTIASRRFLSRDWVRRPKFGSEEWATEEALEVMRLDSRCSMATGRTMTKRRRRRKNKRGTVVVESPPHRVRGTPLAA